MRLVDGDQLAQRVGADRTLVTRADDAPDDDPVTQIVLAQHDRPPPNGDTKLRMG
jgi:hypothetical protein